MKKSVRQTQQQISNSSNYKSKIQLETSINPIQANISLTKFKPLHKQMKYTIRNRDPEMIELLKKNAEQNQRIIVLEKKVEKMDEQCDELDKRCDEIDKKYQQLKLLFIVY